MSVREGLRAYLDENGFTVEGYDDKWTQASVLGVRFAVPNTPRHRWAIMLHDLHHVATGYGTDVTGEGEVSAWETRRGLRDLGAYVSGIVLAGTLAGVILAPRRAWSAWCAPGASRSLFVKDIDYAGLLNLSIVDLRQRLGIPRDGIAGHRELHSLAPKAVQPGRPRA
jgi:hypothetical protein